MPSSALLPGYVRQSEQRLSEPRYCRLDQQRKHPVRGPPWAGRDCGMFHGGPGRLRNSRGLKPHPGRTDSPGFLPIWGRTFPYHGNVADGQLRQTGSGDETVQPLLPRQTEQFRNFTNRLGFQSGEFPNNPGWFDSGAIGQLGRVQLKQMPQIASCGEVIPGSGGFQAKPVIWAVRPGSSAAFGCAVFAPAAGGGAPPIGCAPA